MGGALEMNNETVVTSLAGFLEWLETGTTPRCVYHRGCHVTEHPRKSSVETPDEFEERLAINQKARAMAKAVWRTAADRRVYLVQRRVKGSLFDYLAIRAEAKVPLVFAALG